MTRFLVSIVFFAALSFGVGLLLSGDDYFEWPLALGLFGVALAGEAVRLWIRRDRARTRQSSEI
ncbi:hypothetical protein [Kribbella sp. CA-293567]|uniref:hypothetical protein n=1 Tax=Kribbella sp. CA-293567 TaxID=3002436 RepID=UPI0022DD0AFC|nr:hypothetical protein [Kribbella sp. CA-293567]WBQ05810.1 hypothetical protein OX958_03180 [Kribbella sp. CA-293567]